MDATLSWLNAYVPGIDRIGDREFADAMTLSGTKCEGFVRKDKNLEKIFVGKIEKIERHPDADKLVVCQVNVGEKNGGVIQIVTGATNVEEGQKVPVVLSGGKVAGGHDGGPLPEDGIVITAGALRGVESNGMLCSIEELGSDRNFYPDAPENGIYILPEDAPVGADAVELLGLRDTVFEFEVTSNRVDCYSILGIAREAAATFGLEFNPPMQDYQFGITGEPQTTGEEISEKIAEGIDAASQAIKEAATTIMEKVSQVTGASPMVKKEYDAGHDDGASAVKSDSCDTAKAAASEGHGEDGDPDIIDSTADVVDKQCSDYIRVKIEDYDLCRRYCARVCKDVKIAPSPEWMQRRLANMGIRPINNLVDITNYVMLEYGQPMHAYDMDTIAGNTIIVRRANDGDRFVTLDGQTRNLDHDVLMICDGEKEVGIGGIMGGENSMITDSVTTVLFEAANFNGANIRKSAKRVGLRTDASSFFEKGLDPHNAAAAVDRACALMEELGAGTVVPGMVDVYSNLPEINKIPFEPDKINSFLGTDIPKKDMVSYLARVGLKLDRLTGNIICPTFRQDLEGFADIAEEVARFYGYDKIPTTLPSGESTRGGLSFKQKVEKLARSLAQSRGYCQSMTYSFESPKVFDKLLFPEDDVLRRAVPIANPLGEDFSIMKTSPMNGILTSLATNHSRRNKDVRLYEMARIYLPESLPLKELPDERLQFTLGSYGSGDFYDLKAVVEELLDMTGIPGMNDKGRRDRIEYSAEEKKPFLHPGRQAIIRYRGHVLGYMGEVHPIVCRNYELPDRVYVAVLDMPVIMEFASFDKKYSGVARFPAITRDISMVVPISVSAGRIEDIIAQRGGKLLESFSLFDIYEGEQIEKGFKSMAYNLVFRDSERTLEDADADSAMKKILNGLEGIGINLRK